MAAVKLDFLINGVTEGCVVRRNTLYNLLLYALWNDVYWFSSYF